LHSESGQKGTWKRGSGESRPGRNSKPHPLTNCCAPTTKTPRNTRRFDGRQSGTTILSRQLIPWLPSACLYNYRRLYGEACRWSSP
jgi:hypothetical protein